MAIVTLHASWFVAEHREASDQELLEASITVAVEIIDAAPASEPDEPGPGT
jgi:hypothetical protein